MAGVIILQIAWRPNHESIETLRNLTSRFDQLRNGQLGCEELLRSELVQSRQETSVQARDNRTEIFDMMAKLSASNEAKLEQIRATVDGRLSQLRDENAQRLEQMRLTVDEKLQGTLERRLGDSFKQVSERLEQVHRGLGEMQTLATGVGDLKKVLTNVKTRGTWGEVQLGELLEDILTPSQFERNVRTKAGSSEAVEYGIKLPGRGEDADSIVWLPVDAKFPIEDYERLVDAQEQADPILVEESAKALRQRVRQSAKEIASKYLNPPTTTDFAIMFLPREGLFAEVIRQQGVVEELQKIRIVLAGPTTFGALLNSLQMGFRTLTIQKRSSEVWTILGQVKTAFANFASSIEAVKKKLQEASNKMDDMDRRSNVVQRQLRNVEGIPILNKNGQSLDLVSRVELELTDQDPLSPAPH